MLLQKTEEEEIRSEESQNIENENLDNNKSKIDKKQIVSKFSSKIRESVPLDISIKANYGLYLNMFREDFNRINKYLNSDIDIIKSRSLISNTSINENIVNNTKLKVHKYLKNDFKEITNSDYSKINLLYGTVDDNSSAYKKENYIIIDDIFKNAYVPYKIINLDSSLNIVDEGMFLEEDIKRRKNVINEYITNYSEQKDFR